MTKFKQIKNDGISEIELATSDVVYGGDPAKFEQIRSDRWDKIVALHDNGTGLSIAQMEVKAMATLGVGFNPDNLTLQQVKDYWKNKLAKDCDMAIYSQYSLIQILYYSIVATGAGKTAAVGKITSYALALNTAWTAVDAAATKEAVMAVVFVPPA
jgi:hypothetical protein